MIQVLDKRKDYTNFGEDIQYNCNKLLKLAEQIDSRLTELSINITNQDELNDSKQLVLAINHEIKTLASIWNSINDEYVRLEQLNRKVINSQD